MRIAHSIVLLASLCLPYAAMADTIGNDPTVAGSQVDGCTNCSFVLANPFVVAGATVTTYSFNAFYAERDLTPVLFSGVDNLDGTMTFTVTGVGATVTPTSTGLHTYAFDLQSGSDITGANTYFGFTDTSGGLVDFDYGSFPSTTNIAMYLVAYGFDPTVTNSFSIEDDTYERDSAPALNDRVYSVEATAVAPTPEPSSVALLGTGILGLIGVGRWRVASIRTR